MAYTQAELIERLIKYTEILGYAPRTTELVGLGGPKNDTFKSVFRVKTWAEVIEAAGLSGMVVPQRHKQEERIDWTPEFVIEVYRQIIEQDGTLPMEIEWTALRRWALKFFPDIRAVVTLAGYNYDMLRKISRIARKSGTKGLYQTIIHAFPHTKSLPREEVIAFVTVHPIVPEIVRRVWKAERRNKQMSD